jgi:hypothetical protein
MQPIADDQISGVLNICIEDKQNGESRDDHLRDTNFPSLPKMHWDDDSFLRTVTLYATSTADWLQ